MDQALQEVVDRLALRALVDTYARAVDDVDVDGVVELFAPDGQLVAHAGGGDPLVRSGRADITDALTGGLARYHLTTHVVGGQVVTFDAAGASGVTTCLAHHIYDGAGGSRLLVMAVRYDDRYVRLDGRWRFARRELHFDWRDDRPVGER